MSATHFSGPIVLGPDSMQTLTGAKTVTREESGTTFVLNAAAGAAITLPALKAGQPLHYRFVVGATFATTNWTITAVDASSVFGVLVVNGAGVAIGNNSGVQFVATAEHVSDYVELFGDGSIWHVNGLGHNAGGIIAIA